MNDNSNENDEKSSLRSLREIRERIVTLLLDQKEALRTDIISAIAKLLEGIETGNLSFIDAALANLGVDRGHKLFNRVGNLARSLHTSLHELKEHLARENYSINTTNIPEATDKLERIIEMTFSAADRTFRLMDLQTETLKKIKVELDTLEEFISSSDAEKLSIHT
ncbi:MAG: protein phosphatase CheZ, partial [SAR324 cluster bacterium]|nr:protein phosphatase CheZ [SAR324 cluster bacterium]